VISFSVGSRLIPFQIFFHQVFFHEKNALHESFAHFIVFNATSVQVKKSLLKLKPIINFFFKKKFQFLNIHVNHLTQFETIIITLNWKKKTFL